jgi:hypothetical protein
MHKQRSLAKFPAIILFCGMILANLLIAAYFYREEIESGNANFSRRTEAQYARINRVMHDTSRSLIYLNKVFTAFGAVQREQFTSIALQLRSDFPHVLALAYHREVADGQRALFERQHANILPGGTITAMVDGQRQTAPAQASYRMATWPQPGTTIAWRLLLCRS